MTETWRSPELHPKPDNTNIIKGSAVRFSLLCRHAARANINRLCFIHFRVSFMNNQKQQKPTLTGQRFKTRKRGLCASFSALHAFYEKERFDPTQFQESIVQGLNQTGTDLEAVAKFLDASGAKLDYRRYAETLFDILVAGGMLAPGGTLSDDMTRTEFCLFTAQEDLETMQAYAQVFNKLIRRYKYLEKGFEEEIKKLLLFLKGFTESERNKLAMLTGILLANGNISASILNSLYNENLVKEGVSAAFAVKLFKSWINEKDINSVAASLRKVGMDNRLMELFPANKRSCEHFSKYFTDAGLKELSDFARNQQSIGARKELQKELQEQMSRGDPQKEVRLLKEMKKANLSEQAMISIIWSSLMGCVEWNKKEELVTEQAIKHLKQYSLLLKAFTSQGLSELSLLLKIQEYCYDNIHFMNSFQKIAVLLYKADVLSEEAILKWYSDAHLSKGRSVFLEQMKKFVEWLKNAEEESESDEEETD
uniref:Basic leucine zipper and W2 domains 1a n=1 Tax=Sparus aurata TaxID=8175 RepID=A0A671YUH8_SPAAU